MGVQRTLAQCKGTLQRMRERKKTLAGRTRLWGTSPSRERMEVGELTGYAIQRTTMKGHVGGHPEEERDTATDRLQRGSAGSAFGWWTSQSKSEQQATIARIMGETEALVTRQKKAEAAKKRNAAATMRAGKKKETNSD